jgi:hypothetical protein
MIKHHTDIKTMIMNQTCYNVDWLKKKDLSRKSSINKLRDNLCSFRIDFDLDSNLDSISDFAMMISHLNDDVILLCSIISWRFCVILLSDSWFMCFVSNKTRLKFSDIFNCITSTRIIEFNVFARIEKKNIQATSSTIISLSTTLKKNQSY